MRAVVTVIGKDKKGIIAKVSDTLWKNDVNILDITQNVLQDIFAMVALVDLGEAQFMKVEQALKAAGENLGMKILIMHEDIFNSMHRI